MTIKLEKTKFIKFGDVYVNPEQIAYIKTRSLNGGFNITLYMSDGRNLEMTFNEDAKNQMLEALGVV